MDTEGWLRSRVEAIVRGGREVRQQVANAVAAASQHAQATADGFAEVLRATMDGAARAVADAVPKEREGTLRQVVDGLGDGLAMAAHAAELTLREVGGDSARFAREDLARLGNAFRDVSRRFVDGVAAALSRAGGHAAGEASALRAHAAATLRRVEAPFAAAVAAASRDPVGLGREALTAGVAAARGAVGALCTAMGQKLQAMGVALVPPRAPTD